MMIKLKRSGIFFLGLSIILSYFVFNRLLIIYQSDVTTGTIVEAGRSTMAEFENADYGTIRVRNNDRDIVIGTKVPILYNREAPAIAYIYTTYNFWVGYLLYSLILIVPWSAFAWGYVSPTKEIEIKIPIGN
jgi:hypothetical protein